MTNFYTGQRINITTTFRNTSGTLADPQTVIASAEAPDGTQTAPTPAQSSTGVYVTSVLLTLPGKWYIKVTGYDSLSDDSGDLDASDYTIIDVKSTRFD